jgi:hypothetical protein
MSATATRSTEQAPPVTRCSYSTSGQSRTASS